MEEFIIGSYFSSSSSKHLTAFFSRVFNFLEFLNRIVGEISSLETYYILN